MYVDIHAHLDSPQFTNDLKDVIERAQRHDVKVIIQNGGSPVSNRESLKMGKKYKIVKAALGIDPIESLHTIKESSFGVDEELKFIEKNKNKIIAIGEVGLDHKLAKKNLWEKQKQIFQQVLDLAKKIKKPVLVHSRKAEDDVLTMLEQNNMKNIVLHCFQGEERQVFRALDNGFKFSIPCIVVYDKHFQRLASVIPQNRILTESDSPFLSPVPRERNEPANIEKSVTKIAELHGLTSEEMAKIIYKNYKTIFE
ncbi:hypothetical protein DRJ17_02210 [Candidatus Woesearchaeota archaeon]|nr:MAG: hypothetical protein DRJ17_02210 [Candidatus Woesearchaeota archaeon]